MKLKLVGSFICIAMLSGCTSMMQKDDFGNFHAKLDGGDFKGASEVALDNAGYDSETGETSDLIWTLQAGATLSYVGETELSTKLLDASEVMMKEEDKEGAIETGLETVGSIIGNDAMLDYTQTQYDGVMTNTIKAWNFIAEENYQDARVELNRAEERQRRAADHFASVIKKHKEEIESEAGESTESIKKTIDSDATQAALKNAGIETGQWKPYEGYINPFTTYTYGLNLLLTGKTKSDFQKAADAFKRVYSITGSKSVKKDYDLARSMAKSVRASKLNEKVWVIFENGQSVVKEEKRLDLPVFILSENVAYAGIALPRLKERGVAFNSISVNKEKTEVIADMDKIIGSEFEQEFPYILAREITRVTLKTIAQKQIKDENQLLGNAFAAIQALSTGADIRTFSALPSQYQVVQVEKKNNIVEIKAGNFTIPVVLDELSNKHIIYVKAVSPKTQPLINVVNI
ncbi:COG3014 family protein [Aliivibrio wodanis]|uniref:COG3014 family protein n=1 Tax=Aliivibrio wodanis TaxID=80852 RepID=UPI00406CC5E7